MIIETQIYSKQKKLYMIIIDNIVEYKLRNPDVSKDALAENLSFT